MLKRVLALLSLVVVIAGCGAPQMVAYSEACTSDNNGKQLAVEGYVSLGGDDVVLCHIDRDCWLKLNETPGTKSNSDITLVIPVGDGANSMDELPTRFTPDSLRIRRADGSPVRLGDKVRVSGRTSDSVAPGGCFVAVDKIE